jgi:putative nucleotidyltransferase with HDIG domain
MSKNTVERILEKIDSLPEPPQVAMRVRQMMENTNTTAEMIAEVIRTDPGFTGQVLKLCNSASYGLKYPVATIKEAVAILGFATLKSMIYTILAKSALSSPTPGYALKPGDLWYHSVTCATYAKHLAKRETGIDPEQAFTGGLLHCIGKVLLSEHVGANYHEIEQRALQKRISFLEAEEEVLGVNHCQAGGTLAKKWGFPDLLVGCIRYYHKPLLARDEVDMETFRLITTVHVASLLTRMVGKGNGSDGLMYTLDTEALVQAQWKDVSARYFEAVISEVIELNTAISQLADSMKVKV